MRVFLVGDDLVIDPSQRKVLKKGIELSLSELSYRLLVRLVESAPHIVSHDDLMTAVWPDRVVSDENLKKRVSRLREVLAETSDNPKYFIAERGLGYRCIAHVIEQDKLSKNEVDTVNKDIVTTRNKSTQYFIIAMSFITLCLILVSVYSNGVFVTSSEAKGKEMPDYLFQATQYYSRFNLADNERAISLYEKAIKEGNRTGSTYSGMASAYAQGYYQFGKGELWLKEASSLAKKAIAAESDQPWGYASLGFSLYLSGHYPESIAAYKKASELAPNWGVAVAYRALVYLAMGETLAGYQAASEALDKAPGNPEVMTILALCYRELYMPKHAKRVLEQSLENNPDYLLSSSLLAQLSMLEKNYIQANSILQNNLTLAPNSQFDHWLFFLLHLQTNKLALAGLSLERASLLGGRYTLPSQIYLSIIKEDTVQLAYQLQRVNDEIVRGNQWSELTFGKGIILLALQKKSAAIDAFEKAIQQGFNQEYRFKHFDIFLTVADDPRFNNLLKTLARKNRQKPLKRVPRQ